ncbi:chitin deacetylase [Chitinispirillum alkaliphilum]|nr:chitin deacetylase [Chitinispirillum alkaliphilum]
MFITIGFDDNSRSGIPRSDTVVIEYPEGMLWALEYFRTLTNPAGSGNPATFDGTPARVAFYNTTYYASGYNGDNPALIRRMWNKLYEDGHEIGNHTHSHSENLVRATADIWRNEIQTCMDWMTKPLAPDTMPLWMQAESSDFGSGIPRRDIVGFRTPFLAYGDSLFPTLKEEGIIYDCTIEEGNHREHDGTNFRWPYTLDNGSPGHTESWRGNPDNSDHFTVPKVPGLWQLPNHVALVPSQEEAARYGIEHCIRSEIAKNIPWFNSESGKITLFDYNIWHEAELSDKEFLAILKFTFHKRLEGNRAPLMIGAHSEYFHSDRDERCPNAPDTRERQKVFEDFLEYTLTYPMVRIVRPIDIITWVRDPVPLPEYTSVAEGNRTQASKRAEVSITLNGFQISLGEGVVNGNRVPLTLYTPQGRMVSYDVVPIETGRISWNPGKNLASGAYILDIGGVLSRSIVIP